MTYSERLHEIVGRQEFASNRFQRLRMNTNSQIWERCNYYDVRNDFRDLIIWGFDHLETRSQNCEIKVFNILSCMQLSFIYIIIQFDKQLDLPGNEIMVVLWTAIKVCGYLNNSQPCPFTAIVDCYFLIIRYFQKLHISLPFTHLCWYRKDAKDNGRYFNG